MNTPLISVVTVNLNGGKTLKKALDSVLTDKPDYLEYIIYDGVSTDNSIEIIEEYKDRIDKIIIEKDTGPTNALCKALTYATGKYLLFLFSDDYYDVNFFHQLYPELLENFDIISFNCKYVDTNFQDIKIFSDSSSKKLSMYNSLYYPHICAKAFKRDIFEKYGTFTEKTKNGQNLISADLEFILKCYLNKLSYTISKSDLFYNYMVHINSETFGGNKKTILKCYKEHIEIFCKNNKLYKINNFLDKITFYKWFLRATIKSLIYTIWLSFRKPI